MSKLYIVGTPIGNLSDMSPRGVETLRTVDFIAAEDTRVTLKLLNHFDIKKPMVSYYEHNLREKGKLLVERIAGGETCALVSDAGMPCISDPGEDLVTLCRQAGIPVEVVPGPSAAISALCISGLATSRFTFEGFLSTNRQGRATHLQGLMREERTMLFYEAPHKLLTTLQDLEAAFGGDRRLSVARELTKLHEEVLSFTLREAVEYFTRVTPKGEFVLVVEGFTPPTEETLTLQDVALLGQKRVEAGERAVQVAKELAQIYGYTKSAVYQEMLSLSDQ